MMNESGWDDDLDLGSNDDEDISTQSDVEPTGGTIRMGQGLLFGGLSRLIEAVTQPEESSLGLEEEGDGWEQDEEVLEEVMVSSEARTRTPPQPLLLPVNVPPTPLEPNMASVPSPPAVQQSPQQEYSGWDEDFDIEEESMHEESQLMQTSEAPVQHSGWDDTLDGLEDTLSAQEPTDVNNNGWDDTLDGLDDSLQVDETDAPVEPPPPATQDNDGGWDHDSLEGLDDEEGSGWGDDDLNVHDGFPTSETAGVVVDHVPTHKPTLRTESLMTNADESTVQRENARDEEDFEPSDDYGPVVDHLPSEHLRYHGVAPTVSTLAPESCVQTLEAEHKVDIPPRAATANDVIDHVPDDVSNVPTDNDDSTASVDGDENVMDGDFGPVVDRMPSGQLSSTHTPRTTSTNVPSTVNESLDEENREQATQQVDHVPNNIEDVPPKNDDSTATVDGDDTCDMRKEDALLDAQQEPMEVDHVPDDVSNVPTDNDDSTASVDGDEASDMPQQEQAEESESREADFGPVVDHMPSQHYSTRQHDRTVSAIAPPSLNEELDDDTQTGGASSVQAVVLGRRSPGVVDHVPDDGSKSINRIMTRATATEMSVASELSNTLGDEALESDVDAQEENYGPVVDHTPLQQSIHSRRNPSVRVQAPIEEIDEETDDEEQYFGPVVDHTPTLQASAVCSVAGSMAVAAPPGEIARDSDDDSDDRSDTIDEQEEASDFCDDDTPTASLVSVSRYGPALVDHVPSRPEGRPTDASTLVVVDPSEVSTVGDMTYEEQQYGPVVDHLPSARPATQASATGSTVNAATASVGPDDTLVDDMDDVADDGRTRDENEYEADDGATLPTLDNPPPMETNVVDHVPEEDPPTFRIDSVLTTAPTQSVLSAEETRDSQFGLVVDHTPFMPLPSPPSRGSMAVLAPESVFDADLESGFVEDEASMPAGEQPASERTTEEAKIVVDHLPPALERTSMHPADSTVTVRSHISDDDTLEAIARPERFGPVVDQLPASGISVQRSLGGSTTGALATLSEVNDDTIVDEDTPGWDYDEHELDSIQDTENGRQSRPRPSSRGLSVTFSHETVKTVQKLEAEGDLFTTVADETQYFDAELGDTPAKSVDETHETQYFDPESGEIVNGETSDGARGLAAPVHMSGGSRSVQSPGIRCTSCDEANGTECPCIQRILRTIADEGGMVVSVLTPEGVSVEIDLKKLLQDETTKRLLLEKELDAYKSTVGSLETEVLQSGEESTRDRMAAKVLRSSIDHMAKELDSIKVQRDALELKNRELTSQLTSSQNALAEHAHAAQEWAARESALQSEIEEANSESQQLATMGDELASEIDQMRNANEDLLLELEKQKSQCNALEAENKGLVDDCAWKERRLSEMAEERSDLSNRKSALEDETLQLRRALEETAQTVTSESDLRTQLSSLQIEAAARSGECEELRAQVEHLQTKLQESEGRGFAQMKESMRVKRLHDGEIHRLQEQIQSLQKARQAAVDEHNASVRDLNDKMSRTNSELRELRSENESLKKVITDTRSECEGQLRHERSAFQMQASQLRGLETKVKMVEAQKAKAVKDLSEVKSQLKESVEQSNAPAALQEEYDSLQQTLVVNKETILSLQEQVDALSAANKTGADQTEYLVESISVERDSLRRALESKEKEVQDLQSELRDRASENAALENRLETIAAKCGEMEATVEDLRSKITKHEMELAEKNRLCESLRESQSRVDNDASSQVREESERKVRTLNQLVSEKEQSLKLLQSQLETQVTSLRDRDSTIAHLEQQHAETQQRIESITRDRDNTLSRFKELDAELARTREQQTSSKESARLLSERGRELQERLDVLASERDAALKERDMLEEDSEELLVQLGLMKEEIDAHEGEVAELQQAIAEKDVAIKHSKERLREAEEYIGELRRTNEEVRPQENGEHESGKLAELENIVDELTLAKEDLQQQVDDLSSTNAYIDAQVTSLRDEKVELLKRLKELEQFEQSSGAGATAKEEEHSSRISELEEQCRYLEEVCRLKDDELRHASLRLQESQVSFASSQANINSLRQQIAQLESACAEQGHVLHDRDRALEDMRLELEGLRSQGESSTSPRRPSVDTDSDALYSSLQHAERSSQHYQERLREMEAVLEQARRELKAKTEKLAETESMLFDRDLELDLQEQEMGSEHEELQKQLHEMEALLAQRNREIQEAFERERSLEKALAALQTDLVVPEESSRESATNGPSSNAVEETRQLRSQLSALQQQLQSSSAECIEREERARQDVMALHETIARKKKQIESLEKQLQSLSVEFSSSQDQLVSKEADYRRLSIELEETRVDQLQSTRTVTSQLLESSSKEQAESVDNMRAHIISLAQALERSETQRADAIERLLNERKASADSLRRLGESVKRFYSSLSYRDA